MKLDKQMTPASNKRQPKRVSLSLFITIFSFMLIFLGMTLFFGINWYVNQTAEPRLVNKKGEPTLESVQFLYQLVQESYISDVPSQTLIDGALKGMTEAIGDQYSVFFSGEEATSFDQSVSGEFEGIGATMSLENGYPVVADPPIKGSPAEKAQLRAGDIILTVDQKETRGRPLGEVVNEVRGKKGTKVTLEIKRDNQVMAKTLVRDTIPVESVQGEILADHPTVGHIRITNFASTTTKELVTTIKALRKQGMKQMVLDVRGNPGGILSEVESIASLFLDNGQVIVKVEDAVKKQQKIVASDELRPNDIKVTEPVVLLVDENSASASEILAGALHESAGIDIVGKKTFGKGTVQQIIPFGKEAELKMTIAKWLTPDGNWINKKGFEPNIKASLPDIAYVNMIDRSMTYVINMEHDSVRTIHQILKALGYINTAESNQFTVELESAVKAFQKDHQLPVDGKVNQKTADKLEITVREWLQKNDTQLTKALEVLKQ